MRTVTGLVLGGLGAVALALSATAMAEPAPLEVAAATRTLHAVHEARASAYALGMTTATVPGGLTATMTEEVARQQTAIHEAATRLTTDRYEAVIASVDPADPSCAGSTCEVDYRVITEFVRPASEVAAGAPQTMGMGENRRAEFVHDADGAWLLSGDRSTEPPGGISDPYADAIRGS